MFNINLGYVIAVVVMLTIMVVVAGAVFPQAQTELVEALSPIQQLLDTVPAS